MNLFQVGRIALVLSLSSSVWAASGVAKIAGTSPTSAIQGTVTFQDSPAGLVVAAQLTHVPTGTHGFHIHEFGACDESGKAAGGHYNPMNMPHGQVVKDGIHKAHAGDLGNIIADASGNASLNAVIPGITLAESQYTVGGRAVIVHEKADDFGQPVGNAGGRIGCGVITLTSATPATTVAPAK